MKQSITITLLIACLCCGCTQREYQHDIVDPNGVSHTYYYKSNSIASDSYAESVRVTTPDGTILEVTMPVQENDSIRAISPYGVVETE